MCDNWNVKQATLQAILVVLIFKKIFVTTFCINSSVFEVTTLWRYTLCLGLLVLLIHVSIHFRH